LLQYVVFGMTGACALPWQPQAPDRSRNGDGTRVIDILQAEKRCVSQGRSRSSKSGRAIPRCRLDRPVHAPPVEFSAWRT
jgi:hypothetical protein